MKPWLEPSSWQKAVGEPWEEINFAEIAHATRTLAFKGELRPLKEAQLAINRKGAPSNKDSSDMQERAKNFLEELGEDALAEEETRRVMSGASGALV